MRGARKRTMRRIKRMREERCIAVFARRRSRQRAALAARSCAFLSGERLDRNCLWPDLPPAIPLVLRAWAPPLLALPPYGSARARAGPDGPRRAGRSLGPRVSRAARDSASRSFGFNGRAPTPRSAFRRRFGPRVRPAGARSRFRSDSVLILPIPAQIGSSAAPIQSRFSSDTVLIPLIRLRPGGRRAPGRGLPLLAVHFTTAEGFAGVGRGRRPRVGSETPVCDSTAFDAGLTHPLMGHLRGACGAWGLHGVGLRQLMSRLRGS